MRTLLRMPRETAQDMVETLFNEYATSSLSGTIDGIEDFDDEVLKMKLFDLDFLKRLVSAFSAIKNAPSSSHFEFIEVMDED